MSFDYKKYLTPEWDKHWSKLHSLRGGARAKAMTKSRQGKSLPYEMSKTYLKYLYWKQKGLCAVSGTPLRLEYLFVPYHPLAPSKDRLDNDPDIGFLLLVKKPFHRGAAFPCRGYVHNWERIRPLGSHQASLSPRHHGHGWLGGMVFTLSAFKHAG